MTAFLVIGVREASCAILVSDAEEMKEFAVHFAVILERLLKKAPQDCALGLFAHLLLDADQMTLGGVTHVFNVLFEDCVLVVRQLLEGLLVTLARILLEERVQLGRVLDEVLSALLRRQHFGEEELERLHIVYASCAQEAQLDNVQVGLHRLVALIGQDLLHVVRKAVVDEVVWQGPLQRRHRAVDPVFVHRLRVIEGSLWPLTPPSAPFSLMERGETWAVHVGLQWMNRHGLA